MKQMTDRQKDLLAQIEHEKANRMPNWGYIRILARRLVEEDCAPLPMPKNNRMGEIRIKGW